MFFSILIVVGVLLVVSCAATVGHFMLSARETRRRLAAAVQEADRPDPSPRPSVPGPFVRPTDVPDFQPQSAPNVSRRVIVTAQPSVRFMGTDTGAQGTESIPYGTYLVQVIETDRPNRWMGASRDLSDEEIERLISGGYAIDIHTQQMDEALRRINPRWAEDLTASLQRIQSTMRESYDALPENFQALVNDINRSFSSSFVRSHQRIENPPTAPKKPAPKPDPSIPKSAIDRLLEDNLIEDDDSGVK